MNLFLESVFFVRFNFILFFVLLCFSNACFSESKSLNDGFMTLPEDESAISEIYLGNKTSKNKIKIYISPSCLHCGKFLVEDVDEFLKKNNEKVKIIVKLLPASAKDIFIMKLIQNESKDENGYFAILKNYIMRVLATINYITPSESQISMFKGSKTDPEMIKFQVEASEFGFSDEKIIKAFPDMDQLFEKTIMKRYAKSVKFISKILDSKELNLPLIVKEKKVCKTLKEAVQNE